MAHINHIFVFKKKVYRETSSALVSADLKRSPRQLNHSFNSFFLHLCKSAFDIIEPRISSQESCGNKLRTRQVILRLQIGIIKQTSPLDRLSKHTSAQERTGRSTELSSELEHAMLAASKQVMQRWWLKSIRE